MGEMVFGVSTEVLRSKESRRLLRNIARREMDCISSMKYGYIYAKHDKEVGEWKYLEIADNDDRESKKAKKEQKVNNIVELKPNDETDVYYEYLLDKVG